MAGRSHQTLSLLLKWLQKMRQQLLRLIPQGSFNSHLLRADKPWWQQDIKELLQWMKAWRQNRFIAQPGISSKFLDLESSGFRYVVLLCWFVLVIGLSGALLWPVHFSKHGVLINERQMLESRFLRQQQLIQESPIYQRQIELILSQVGSLLDAVPESMEPVHVLSLINKAASDAGVQIELFRPMLETTEDYYAVLPIEIRLTGDFHALGKFMEKISYMQHLITVDVSISASASHENLLVMASLLKAYRNNMAQRSVK